MTTGGDRVGGEGRGREREREQRVNGVRDRVLDRNGNGVGQKWPLVKMYTLVFLVKQIKTTNKLSIKLGGSQTFCHSIYYLFPFFYVENAQAFQQ